MELTWHGHSCFTVSHRGYRLVLDPYAPGKVDGFGPLSLAAEEVLCSHDHFDHNYVEAVTLSGSKLSSPFTVTRLDTWHDDEKGKRRGKNVMHILEADGLRVAHLGDLGCRIEEEQLQRLMHVDAVMIPVGGYFTIDAKQAKKLVGCMSPRVVVPMHFKGENFGFPVLSPLSDFTSLFPPELLRRCEGNSLVIEPDMPQQVAILRRPS
jgi:L-ascorbate metabolism protein UlaG (beta-lactamase superfamily)